MRKVQITSLKSRLRHSMHSHQGRCSFATGSMIRPNMGNATTAEPEAMTEGAHTRPHVRTLKLPEE